jgi:DNA-3-methyladenine glycosylase I
LLEISIFFSMTYCTYCRNLPIGDLHRDYHDREYGVLPSKDEDFFERLILEINQAGLSWNIILKKRESFRLAYKNYHIESIANLNETDISELLSDPGIVRNRLKVNAAIKNAQRFVAIKEEYGSFYNWLTIQKAEDLKEWVKIFKKNFTFVGGEIVGEFLKSCALINGAHDPDCKYFKPVQ